MLINKSSLLQTQISRIGKVSKDTLGRVLTTRSEGQFKNMHRNVYV